MHITKLLSCTPESARELASTMSGAAEIDISRPTTPRNLEFKSIQHQRFVALYSEAVERALVPRIEPDLDLEEVIWEALQNLTFKHVKPIIVESALQCGSMHDPSDRPYDPKPYGKHVAGLLAPMSVHNPDCLDRDDIAILERLLGLLSRISAEPKAGRTLMVQNQFVILVINSGKDEVAFHFPLDQFEM